MNRRVFTLLSLATLLLCSLASFGDTTSAQARKRAAARLVSVLPASDAVGVFQAGRFFSDALPHVLASQPTILTAVTDKLNDIQTKTGIDLRKFDQVAFGVAYRTVSPTKTDFDTVAVANGDVNAAALVAVGRLAAKGNYHEEKVGERTIYIFTTKDIVQNTVVQPQNSKVAGVMNQAFDGLTKDVAVAALDNNTLVIGSPARVRETLQGSSHVSAELSGMLAPRDISIVSFAARSGGVIDHLLPATGDALGANIKSIQLVAGTLDVTPEGAAVNVLARTKQASQANDLKDTLEGLKQVGGAFLGASKRPDQRIYAHLIQNTRVAARGADLIIDVTIPQADIDSLLTTVH